ncbi:MAG: CPBP family intramembrane metalloprotease, partial [Thermoplasmata archaeon]|nr:CPBP family intramembrane metalloprotease [Thermoplasmata archaeon]
MIEELVDRVLLIGIPLYLIHNYGTRKNRNRPDPNRPEDIYPVPGRRPDLPRHDVDNKGLLSLFTSLFRKENRKYFLGGGLELNTQAVLLLFISSMVFSISHIGWDWTKLIPTFLGGMILGVLFLRKGLHACILLHFAINSFSISYLVAGEPMVLEVVLYSICFGSIPFGAYYLYFYLRFFRRKLSRINLDFRSVEFSKAVTATGGVVLLLFVLFGLFFLGMFALEDDSEEHTEHRYFQLSEGDYCI